MVHGICVLYVIFNTKDYNISCHNEIMSIYGYIWEDDDDDDDDYDDDDHR